MKFKFFFLFSIFLNFSIQETCVPQNIHITLAKESTDSHEQGQVSKPTHKVVFITKTKCEENPTLVIKPYYGNQQLFTFSLVGIYVAKMFVKDETQYYISYTYVGEINDLQSDTDFMYDIYLDYSKSTAQLFKTFRYRSNMTYQRPPKELKIITLGNIPLHLNLKKLVSNLESQTYDLLLLTGNYSYYIYDEFGQKGDTFFNELEPILTKAPVMLVPGNTDMTGYGNLLLHRFRFLENYTVMDNNVFILKYFDMRLTFINFEVYPVLSKKNKRNMIVYLEKTLSITSSKLDMLISHRPFRCLSSMKKEICFFEGSYYYEEFEKTLIPFKMDLQLCSHLSMYQRLNISLFKNKYNKLSEYWNDPDYNITTVISGIGGAAAQELMFRTSININDNMAYKNYVFGFTQLTVKNSFRTVIGSTIDIQDSLNPKEIDNFIISPDQHVKRAATRLKL